MLSATPETDCARERVCPIGLRSCCFWAKTANAATLTETEDDRNDATCCIGSGRPMCVYAINTSRLSHGQRGGRRVFYCENVAGEYRANGLQTKPFYFYHYFFKFFFRLFTRRVGFRREVQSHMIPCSIRHESSLFN